MKLYFFNIFLYNIVNFNFLVLSITKKLSLVFFFFFNPLSLNVCVHFWVKTASFPGDLSYAIAGLIFLEYKASAQWSAELLVVNYRGELRSYLVR